MQIRWLLLIKKRVNVIDAAPMLVKIGTAFKDRLATCGWYCKLKLSRVSLSYNITNLERIRTKRNHFFSSLFVVFNLQIHSGLQVFSFS